MTTPACPECGHEPVNLMPSGRVAAHPKAVMTRNGITNGGPCPGRGNWSEQSTPTEPQTLTPTFTAPGAPPCPSSNPTSTPTTPHTASKPSQQPSKPDRRRA